MGGTSALKSGGKKLAERCQAVIVCAELRNFTRMSEMLEPERVLQLASAFFSLASVALKAHGGEIVSLQNDSLVAAYRGGKPGEIAGHALQAARGLLREFAPLAERWQADYGLAAAAAAGAHLGETLFGMAGQQGAEQYLAFGDSVSIAERLVHRARAGEIVMSAALIKPLGPAARSLDARPLPPLELARRPPLPIYGILLDTRLDFT